MRNIACLECFQAGGLIHAVMVAAAIAFIVRFTGRGRRNPGRDRHLSTVLFAVCATVFVYYLRPNQIGWNHSLPLHVCDITGIMAAIAIRTGNRTARALLHFWGLVLSSQALIFPALEAGPVHCDFWLYWIDHGAIIFAAIYDVRVRNYRPTWDDWRRATLLLALYAMVIAPFDKLTGLDYGFLGQTQLAERSMVSAFGPWPQRLPIMWLCAIGGMALLQARSEIREMWKGTNKGSSMDSLTVTPRERGRVAMQAAGGDRLCIVASTEEARPLRMAS
jgi:hypothetical integral membrane protein (TIGR02206 family)